MEYTRGLSINLRRTSLSESSAARRGVVPSNLEEGTEDYSGSGTAFESAAASEATPNTIQAPPESTDRNELYQNSFMAEVQRFMFINASAFNAITEEVRDPATPTLHHASGQAHPFLVPLCDLFLLKERLWIVPYTCLALSHLFRSPWRPTAPGISDGNTHQRETAETISGVGYSCS